ncbi:TIGR01621 family pseudouridine synthase [Aestuariicella hydrocarbonica]|uniref:TIGR01621 family pseudouridine synthase n=1 Tax=Pseudomaricurvus hydrocarbonicus TaxID=1470433 RepID=A0A9E5JVP3_9GAMM|nr:TIGR01621 family pseudouridine synthase [Aestuariicella hydrocarbonica]NHO65400.1 TIGR01621 family pseudouridine synthase [Aestuariicella hydrocarbonica]
MHYSLIEHNSDFVIVNKAPGITVQRDCDQPGLLELVADELGLEKLYPVHRLDKMTSGVLLMACQPQANQLLSQCFQSRDAHKYYVAISDRKPKKKQGLIKGDMDKGRRGSWKLLTSHNNPAITQFFSSAMGAGLRAFLLKPHTGKTHQLRVALRSLGAPVLGDTRYGGSDSDRGYLHALQLSFPWEGQRVTYRALPMQGQHFLGADFVQLLSRWQAPEHLDWPRV